MNSRSLWGRSAGVPFESLLGHFNSCVFVVLGARPLHNTKLVTTCCDAHTHRKHAKPLLVGTEEPHSDHLPLLPKRLPLQFTNHPSGKR